MVLFQAIKLIQDGIINNEKEAIDMLKQNKYYFLPALNVDGLAFIEKEHVGGGLKTTKVVDKRKNMGPAGTGDKDKEQSCFVQHFNGLAQTKCFECNGLMQGVDLNRNYGIDWQVNSERAEGHWESAAANPCSEFFPGPHGFSEKETQAMRDFLASKKEELRFVVNFHSNGNSFMWPFNGRQNNDIESRAPGVLSIV